MSNRLAGESSPYLLQHQDNPVDWYPWGEEAFEKAGRENKPIFLSIGYSACHWCHVMAHESFEDEETAAILNEHFVSIKVDREERPDVDHIYMNAVQAISGSGGWPMSVWLLPDGRPFFGGTYFPKEPRFRMPAFKALLLRIAELYRNQPENLTRDAANLTGAISRVVELDAGQGAGLRSQVLEAGFQGIAQRYDEQFGGFGDAPKFPPGMTLELLLRLHRRFGWKQALEMATHTLDCMAAGGVYDQLGGGFHRYSVDQAWLVPHFEKMLYDNAMLLRVYVYAYQVTGKPRYRQVADEIVQYAQREMTAPEGGFYSTQDADSEGEEGRFFVWEAAEVHALLRDLPQREAVMAYWALDGQPNFEGKYILWTPRSLEEIAAAHGMKIEALEASVRAARAILFTEREKRIRPGRDEKILAGWNGLMIKSLSIAGNVLDRPDYARMAEKAARFVLKEMQQDGRLLRSYKDGRARFDGVLEDYALMVEALVTLYESSFDLSWFEAALGLSESMVTRFWDEQHGFLDTAHDAERLITRPQDLTDGVLPSGTSAAVQALLRLAVLAGRNDWRERCLRVLGTLEDAIQGYPGAFSYLACAYDFALTGPLEIALAGPFGKGDTAAMLGLLRRDALANQVLAHSEGPGDPASTKIELLRGRDALEGRLTAYVCRNYVCKLPVTSAEALAGQLADSV